MRNQKRTRKVGTLRLKHHQSVLELRAQGMKWMRAAVKATNNAHALFALADKRERDAQAAMEAFYAQQEREGREATVNPQEQQGFMLGHLQGNLSGLSGKVK